MKRLYIVRHAKSTWDLPELEDIERPLSKRGKKDAPKMGKYLKKNKHIPEIIISSPAKRAFKTARLLAEELGYPEENIVKNENLYEAGLETLLDVIRNIEDKYEKAMIVGHNPGFNSLAEALGGETIDNIPTCGVYCVDLDIKAWKDVSKGKGRMVFFDTPKKISGGKEED